MFFITTKIMKKTRSIPHRFESTDTQWTVEHPRCTELLRNAGWFMFFEKITRFNVEVTT